MRNFSPASMFLTLYVVFLLTCATIIFVNYSGQQEQTLEHIQTSATAQTTTIKEALVNMMITNERIDDNYLRKISSTGDIRNISILFRLDSLHLAEDFLEDSSRTRRLAEREVNVWDLHKSFTTQIFSASGPEWYLVAADNPLYSQKLNNLSADKPSLIHKGDELQALIPFIAEKKCTQCHGVQKGQILGAAILSIPLNKTAEMLETNARHSLYIFITASAIIIFLYFGAFRKK